MAKLIILQIKVSIKLKQDTIKDIFSIANCLPVHISQNKLCDILYSHIVNHHRDLITINFDSEFNDYNEAINCDKINVN